MTLKLQHAFPARLGPPPRYRALDAAPAGPPILIVPGIDNSGPDHWQTHWQASLPRAKRVEQADWRRPNLADWTASLIEAVRERPGAVIVAHSLGCAAVAHLAAINHGRGVAAAMLVAPADVELSAPISAPLRGFAPLPRGRLPFPSLVVASRDDPYVAFSRAAAFADDWGSAFVDLGEAGHINADSGLGAWPAGRRLLRSLIAGIGVS